MASLGLPRRSRVQILSLPTINVCVCMCVYIYIYIFLYINAYIDIWTKKKKIVRVCKSLKLFFFFFFESEKLKVVKSVNHPFIKTLEIEFLRLWIWIGFKVFSILGWKTLGYIYIINNMIPCLGFNFLRTKIPSHKFINSLKYPYFVVKYSQCPIFFVLFEKSNFLREYHLLSCLPFKNV